MKKQRMFQSKKERNRLKNIPKKTGPIKITPPENRVFNNLRSQNDEYIVLDHGQIIRKLRK